MSASYKIIGLLSSALILSSTGHATAKEHHLGPTGLFGDVSLKRIKVIKAFNNNSPVE